MEETKEQAIERCTKALELLAGSIYDISEVHNLTVDEGLAIVESTLLSMYEATKRGVPRAETRLEELKELFRQGMEQQERESKEGNPKQHVKD